MSILTKDQKSFLLLFSGDKKLCSTFYFTGGTALTEYYIPYRYSDDLDFFSESEIDTSYVLTSIKKFKEKLGYTEIEFNTSFNRNLVFIKFEDYILKTEFTYFPFPRIHEQKAVGGLVVDSALDIAANKLFTIFQKPRSRDFMDLYMLNKKYGFTIKDLTSKARAKFDWIIDPLKLGSQLLLCTEVKDFPKLLEPLAEKDWQGYFYKQAELLKQNVIE